jgi:hypothetical protein
MSVTRRAVALFVEDKPSLLLHSHWMHQSWRHIGAEDTDLVFMGPKEALEKLPADVVKIEQRPITEDGTWMGYGYVNSIACLAHLAASLLDSYEMILRSDADTFLTPAWNRFYPSELTSGRGGYANDDKVRDNIQRVAQRFGLTHRGVTNVGSALYGPPKLVREICRLATDLTRYIRTVEFKDDRGTWPSWYFGVASMYATEIAVNHLAPSFSKPADQVLDARCDTDGPTEAHPHIHCWHTDKQFSKFAFAEGAYDHIDPDTLDLSIVRDYCLAMALRARTRAAAEMWRRTLLMPGSLRPIRPPTRIGKAVRSMKKFSREAVRRLPAVFRPSR